MRQQPKDETAVLIVGAGPAGLTTAIELARRGVDSLLVERRRERSALPRATGISTRTMELLRSWGLEDEIRAGGLDVEWLGWVCETLARASSGTVMPTGMPTRAQASLISPTSPACVPQDHLEPVLLDHLRSRGPARVELGAEVIGVDSGPDGVRAVVRDVGSGASRVVRSRYLVAADGARSRVRASLGIAMLGPERLGERIAAMFRAPLWELLGEHRYGIYLMTHPEAPGFFLPTGRGERWLYGLEWDPDRESPADYGDERMAQRIRVAAGAPGLRPGIEGISAVSYAAQLAERFRHESAFLVGDAAHRVTPRGGTGMNTAVHDGVDLGWKLAWVLRGWAEPELLETYETERRPVAEHNAARSAEASGSVRGVEEELRADLGGRLPHLWLGSDRGRVSTLDLLGPGLTLFTGPAPEQWAHAAASTARGLPVTVHSLDTITARALGIHGAGALLARPDGMPIALWRDGADAAPSLAGAVSSAGGRRSRRREGAVRGPRSARRVRAAVRWSAGRRCRARLTDGRLARVPARC